MKKSVRDSLSESEEELKLDFKVIQNIKKVKKLSKITNNIKFSTVSKLSKTKNQQIKKSLRKGTPKFGDDRLKYQKNKIQNLKGVPKIFFRRQPKIPKQVKILSENFTYKKDNKQEIINVNIIISNKNHNFLFTKF